MRFTLCIFYTRFECVHLVNISHLEPFGLHLHRSGAHALVSDWTLGESHQLDGCWNQGTFSSQDNVKFINMHLLLPKKCMHNVSLNNCLRLEIRMVTRIGSTIRASITIVTTITLRRGLETTTRKRSHMCKEAIATKPKLVQSGIMTTQSTAQQSLRRLINYLIVPPDLLKIALNKKKLDPLSDSSLTWSAVGDIWLRRSSQPTWLVVSWEHFFSVRSTIG